MYTNHFGLKEKPFSLTANVKYLYMSEEHENAFTMLKYGIMQRAGFILMTGKTGSGKTLLINHLLRELNSFALSEVVLALNPFVIGDDLIGFMIDELELLVTEPGTQACQLRTLEKHLAQRRREKRNVLLIIDEAQVLSDRMLEEVRMLNNLQSGQDILLQVILVGQSELRDRIRAPEMRHLAQRINVACHIGDLAPQETKNYIEHRLKIAGRQKKGPFDLSAIKAIYKESKGNPREVNLLCDTSLTYGFAEDAIAIDQAVIAEVVNDRKESGMVIKSGAAQKRNNSAENGESISGRIAQMENTVKRLQHVVVRHLKEAPA